MRLLFHSEVDDALEWDREMKLLTPDLDFRVWPDVGDESDIEIALVWDAPAGMLRSLPNLKLLLSLGVGVDHLLNDPDLPDVPITRLVDDFCSVAMSEYVLLQVLRFHRMDPVYQVQQRNADWTFHPSKVAADTRVGVMGLGTLGCAAAVKLDSLGFTVSGWSKHRKNVDGVRSYCGESELGDFLGATDILVCLLALTDETQGILNSETFALLPTGAHVINAARGGHLVEADLIAALDSGRLAGAALDCFETEPLPIHDRLWRHPKVFLTPHAATGTNAPAAARHVTENMRRFYASEPLLNELNRQNGY